MTRVDQDAIQEQVQSLLQADDAFAAVSVTLGEFACLANGQPPWAVILPGGLTQPIGDAYGEYAPRLRGFVEVWRPYAPGYADLVAALQAVVDVLNAHPTLNELAGVVLARVTEVSDLLFLAPDMPGSEPQYAGFRVAYEVLVRWSYSGEGEY